MAKNTKAKGAKGSPIVAAPKPETKGKTPIVNVPTPTPTEASAPAAKAKSSVAGTYLSRDQFDIGDGRGSRRMRVAEYQDWTFTINDRPDRQLTDEELCADWHRQFPGAVAFKPFHVRGARRDFNMGRHSRTFTTPHYGDQASVAYVDHDGARVRVTSVPKAKKAAPVPVPTPTPTETPAPAKVAKHVVKVKKQRPHAA